MTSIPTFLWPKKFCLDFMIRYTQSTVPVYGADPLEAGLSFLCLMTTD